MDVAGLNLAVRFDQVEGSTAALKEQTKAASAAERAAQRWGVSTASAGRSSEDFSKRVQGTIRSLEFERQQLGRNADERARYSALRRAGVAAASAEGQAIIASVRALQTQQAAAQKSEEQTRKSAAATREFASQWRSMIGAVSGALGAGAVLKAADSFTALTNAIKVSGAEGASLTYVQDRLFAAANKNGVEIDALGQVYSRIAMAGRELGTSQEGILEFIDGVTAALRVQGGSTESARGALLQLSQALGSGVVRAEEFNSILEGALPIAQAAARGMDGMGGSVAKLRTAILDGKVTSQQFFEATMKGFGETRKQAEGASLTIGQALTTLSNSFISYVGNVDKASGVSAALAKAIAGIGKALTEANKATQAGEGGLFDLSKMLESTVKEVEGIIAVLDQVDKLFRDLTSKVGGYITKAVDSFAVEGARGAAMFLEAFRVVPDALGKLFVDGMNKALAAVESGLREVTAAVANSWLGRRLGVEAGDAPSLGRVAGGGFSLSGTSAQISTAGDAAAGQMRQLQERRQLIDRQAGMQGDEARARLGGMAVSGPIGLGGAAVAGGKGGSDPYAKAVESAREYIATKKAETAAIGMSAEAAARLKHEQELVNKASNDNTKLSAAQTQQLKDLAASMAQADVALSTAKFLDDLSTNTEAFVAGQQAERDSLFMSAEAADAARIATQLLNQAKKEGLDQNPAVVAAIQQSAQAQAAATASTNRLKEAYDLAKTTVTGFLTDIRSNLQQGQGLWDAFGNAGLNALNKITDKLTQMVIDDLFSRAFGGAKGGAGGGSWLTGDSGGGGGIGGFISTALSWIGGFFANGAAFSRGHVTAFARGGVVNRPTLFPMATGAGLMGEAGPEAVMPLQRGPNGRLGVANFGGAQQQGGRVEIVIYDATELLNVKIDNRADARIVKASPTIIKKATDESREQVVPTVNRYKADRQGDWRAA